MKYGSGDDGKSSVLGSNRIWKDDDIFEAIGTVDELNSFIGLARSFCNKSHGEICKILTKIQKDLFKIGSMLAAFNTSFYERVPKIEEKDVSLIDRETYRIENLVGKLKKFILPGGSKLSSYLHVARAVCRRAERRIVKLKRSKGIPDIILKYLNRLSSLLFHLSRYANKLDGLTDVEWVD